MNIEKLAREIHEENVAVGWWDAYPNKSERVVTALMLTITEVAEAVEGDRKSLPDDHLPQYDMRAVELADAAIRLLDLIGACGRRVEILTPLTTFVEQMFLICRMLCGASNVRAIDLYMPLRYITAIADEYGYNIEEIIEAKREYNRKRLDHKRENRATAHGKAY